MSEACDHDHTERGLSGSRLQRALAAAEIRCRDRGERLTDSRRRVLELLLQASGPVKAYDLMAGFSDDGASAKPPTVYRALEFLARLGLVHRIESLNAFVACQSGEDSHAAAFLICECCGSAREIEPVFAAAIEAASREVGYEVRTLTVEARGLCPACRAN
jgi:Fur family zinc uptake transcriptional regulator